MSVPIHVNGPNRPSRLSPSIFHYVRRSLVTIIRVFLVYRPFRFFLLLAVVPTGLGLLLSMRFVYHYLAGQGQGMVQSLILAAVLLISGCFLFVVALLADLTAANRQLLERLDWRLRELEDTLTAHPQNGGKETRTGS